MDYTISSFSLKTDADVPLPASKSLSARALIIGTMAGKANLENLSDCDDTRAMQKALAHARSGKPGTVDIGAAGTAMRFSTAYFAATPGCVATLTGSDRMKHRPIGILVDALRKLGADIEYLEDEGCPPLLIKGRHLEGGIVELPADVSSQYISALLMVAPSMDSGLLLRLNGHVASRPYIQMTVNMMRHFGAEIDWLSSNEILVEPMSYDIGVRYVVEADWSAASYWYEAVALSPNPKASVVLHGLTPDSLQGDRATAVLFSLIGVRSEKVEGGVRVYKSPETQIGKGSLEIDFTDSPDLVQTFVVASAMLGHPFKFNGVESLRIKETDRIEALVDEMQKLGFKLKGDDVTIRLDKPVPTPTLPSRPIETYEDHRMAMAFAPAAQLLPGLRIENPGVVAKSYPNFWTDLRNAGAVIEEND